jgi:hypothetical protein
MADARTRHGLSFSAELLKHLGLVVVSVWSSHGGAVGRLRPVSADRACHVFALQLSHGGEEKFSLRVCSGFALGSVVSMEEREGSVEVRVRVICEGTETARMMQLEDRKAAFCLDFCWQPCFACNSTGSLNGSAFFFFFFFAGVSATGFEFQCVACGSSVVQGKIRCVF